MSKGGKECVKFLKWALPKMKMRWEGFKKVHGQVCSRINKRLNELELENYEEYKEYLEEHQQEWDRLDRMTHITISRIFRDKKQWEVVEEKLLSELVKKAHNENRSFRVWSAGSASGEEPYSFAILWKQAIAKRYPNVELEIIATELDKNMLERTKKAKYTKGSLKEMPNKWREEAFEKKGSSYHLKAEYKEMVELKKQDIRKEMPDGPFDLVFCKNLIAMYFDEELSAKLFNEISDRMRAGAPLLLGNHEEIPLDEVTDIKEVDKGINLYEKKK